MAAPVAPDGSPVPVYLALPPEPELTPVLSAVGEGASVLDLGCGVGRLANVLAERGCDVTGVDESAEMLEHLAPRVRGVQGRIEDIALDERFDVVVLASNLINVPDTELRSAFLRCVRRHLRQSGRALVEHYPAGINDLTGVRHGRAGPVDIRFEVLARRGAVFEAEVTYQLGEDSWVQRFRAEVLDDGQLAASLSAAGLRDVRRLDDSWIESSPTPP